MTEDILDRAKTIQRYVADQTTVSVKMSLLEDMIAEIENLRAEKEARLNRPFQPDQEVK